MTDKAHTRQRSNRVFRSLHKPLTYLGVERTLFYFTCVGAVGAFNLFNSILAGIAVFLGGFANQRTGVLLEGGLRRLSFCGWLSGGEPGS